MTPSERERMVEWVRSPEFERGYDRGRAARRWASEHKGTLALGAAAAVLLWAIGRRGKQVVLVSGYWTDLARKQGIDVGADLPVATAQRYLNTINNKKSPREGGTGLAEDGVLGTKTSAAVRAFQAGNGLPQTGTIDEETGNALAYFAAATSPYPAVRKLAAVSPGVTYTPYPMPQPRYVPVDPGWTAMEAIPPAPLGGKPVTYTPRAMPQPTTYVPSDPRWTAIEAIPPAQLGSFRTGIQSTSMYWPEAHYTDSYGAWVLPVPPNWCWWA